MAPPKKKQKKQKKGSGNSLQSLINKGLTKHEAQNEMMGACKGDKKSGK